MSKKNNNPEQAVQTLSLFKIWAASYLGILNKKSVGSDIVAGITVAAVAIPLNLALAVACGLPPSAGLISGAIGGMLAALFGGTPLQATGPAAALNVIVLGIVKTYGVEGAALAALITALVQFALASLRAGKIFHFVPEAVLAGFTSGVGLKLLDNQIPELLGFDYKVFEMAQMMHQPAWLHHVSWLAVVCGMGVAFLIVLTQQFKKFPAALVGIFFVTALSVYLHWDIERVGAVSSVIPVPHLPPFLADELWLDFFIAAIPLALLASAESLLSSRVIDRMTAYKNPHHPDLELWGQGIANLAVSFFGGMPVTGVVVRSSVNIQSGGKTRLSAFLHGALLLVTIIFLGNLIAQVPLSALAGLLILIGFRLIEVSTFKHLLKTEPVETIVFLAAMIGTASGYLITGLTLGLIIHFAYHYATRHKRASLLQLQKERERGIRAVLSQDKAQARELQVYQEKPDKQMWVSHIQARQHISKRAFIHEQASVIGQVIMGEHVHVAAGSSIRADEGTPFFIGRNTNIQDGVTIHALKNKKVMVGQDSFAVYIGQDVSIAHNALIHGPCYIGDHSFVGFKAVVHDSIVGAHCFIGINAVVVGVEIPDYKLVPHGQLVDSVEAVEMLPSVTSTHQEFNEDVVDVNRGLASAYHEIQKNVATVEKIQEDVSRDVVKQEKSWAETWFRHQHKIKF